MNPPPGQFPLPQLLVLIAVLIVFVGIIRLRPK
jgi:hypothetical protein